MSSNFQRPIVIATRESRLAMWQAEHVQAILQSRGYTLQLLGMTTQGDQILDRSLSKVGGKGLFVKELEVALSEGRADIAVHSLKDVPMDMPEAFEMACVMEREDPRDAWVSAQYPTLMDLPQGAVVGTPSLRRTVLLRALRTDLIEALKPLVHSMSWLAVAAERAVSRAMGGSCSMPLAAHATLSGQVLSLQAAWGNPEGEASWVTAYISGEVNDPQQAEALGDRAAADLKRGGAY